jgi:hypothetical protein
VKLKENNFKNKTIITKREAKNRLKNLYEQLELIHEYEKEFLQIEGTRGLRKRIDEILDEINFLSKFLNLKQ